MRASASRVRLLLAAKRRAVSLSRVVGIGLDGECSESPSVPLEPAARLGQNPTIGQPGASAPARTWSASRTHDPDLAFGDTARPGT
jgi:hypothetical protein